MRFLYDRRVIFIERQIKTCQLQVSGVNQLWAFFHIFFLFGHETHGLMFNSNNDNKLADPLLCFVRASAHELGNYRQTDRQRDVAFSLTQTQICAYSVACHFAYALVA